MTNVSVIILVGREELHIKRCLEKLASLEPRQVFIVESQKGDRTHDLAIETAQSIGWKVDAGPRPRQNENQSSAVHLFSPPTFFSVWHDWPGLQSTQFNWALDNLPIQGSWILRLDADEYLTDDSITWLRTNLSDKLVRSEIAALEFTLERKFCGGLIRHATNGIKMIRMFRRGRARYAETTMDERLVVGKTQKVGGESTWAEDDVCSSTSVSPTPVAFYDDSLLPMDEWRAKHRGYAKREAQQALESLRTGHWTDPRKARYYRLPPYFRAFAYFCIRYFLKRGFLDGRAGWMWNFWQGLWYRLLVDREIFHLKNQVTQASALA